MDDNKNNIKKEKEIEKIKNEKMRSIKLKYSKEKEWNYSIYYISYALVDRIIIDISNNTKYNKLTLSSLD